MRGRGYHGEALVYETATAAPDDDFAHLLGLLGAIGTPAPVSETVDSTLTVLADALGAGLVCVASVVGDRLVPTAAYGVAPDDPVFQSGWPLGGAARDALDRGTPVARAEVAPWSAQDICATFRPHRAPGSR